MASVLPDERPRRQTQPPWQAGTLGVWAVRWGTFAILLAGWELVCHGPLAGNGYLEGPVEVLRDGLPVVAAAEPMREVGHTMLRFAIAFLLAATVGTGAGLVLGRARHRLYLGSRDLFAVLQSMPLVPFYPLFVLWLGLGDRSEVAFGVLHGVVPIALLTMSASADIPAVYLESSLAMGATPVRRLVSVMIPWLAPQIVGALKVGAALSLLGVLLAELMISTNGVGSFISAQIANQGAAGLDAMVVLICFGVLVVNAALTQVERRCSRWRQSPS